MNKRRWVAVVAACALFLFSLVTAGITNKEEKKANEMGQLNELLYGSDTPQEKVLEKGNAGKKIVKLQIDGTIADDGTSSVFSTASYNHSAFMKQLAAIKKDPAVKGVLLEVNSPGGSVYETAEITRQLNAIKKSGVPIYVAMENQAASGGYYVSAGADKIFASDETMTGSIGVIMSNVNYSGLLEKLGISDATIKSGALKDIGSSMRPQTEEDKKVLQAFVDSSYKRFVKVVANGRHMSEDQVRKLADGRIYDGAQAKENGLVDQIGYPDQALKALKKEQGLTGARVVEYTNGNTAFVNSWLGSNLAELQGLKPSQEKVMQQLIESVGTPQAPKAMYLYGGE